jgi:hypothetical protein
VQTTAVGTSTSPIQRRALYVLIEWPASMIMRQSCRRISDAAQAGIAEGCALTMGTPGSNRDGHARRAIAVALSIVAW